MDKRLYWSVQRSELDGQCDSVAERCRYARR
jgi:hypothetical protein